MHFYPKIGLIYCIIGLIFLPLFCFAQRNKDSLSDIANNSPDINARISAQCDLAYQMMWTNPDSAKKMLDKLKSIDSKDVSDENRARVISMTGTNFWFSGNYDSAMFYYRKSIDYSVAHNLKSQYRKTIANLGALFNQLNMSDSAKHYLNIALQLATAQNDTAAISKTYYDLGALYNKMNFNSLALENLLKANTFYLGTQDSFYLAMVNNSLGITYQRLGNFEDSRNALFTGMMYNRAKNKADIQNKLLNNLAVNYWKNSDMIDSAKFFITKAIELSVSNNQMTDLLTYYINLGGITLQQKNNAEALSYFRKAQAIELPFDDPYSYSALFVNLGAVWIDLENTDSAYFYSRKALELASKNNALDQIKTAYKNLFQIDSISKNYLSAIRNYQRYSDFSDSISNVDVRNKIAELEIMYEIAQKDKENSLLVTQNALSKKVIAIQKIIVFVILSALLIFIVFLILLLRNQKKLRVAFVELTRKNIEIEKKTEEIRIKNEHLQIQKQELTELNQTKDKFFSIIAHDLKSPFNALLGFLEILENEFDQMNDSEKFNIIKILHESSENTYSLLINLLDWSRSQRGLLQNQPEALQLHEIANSAISVLDQRFRNKEHQIQNLVPPEHIVYADPNLTQTVFINLINNAIKFTPRSGLITIASQQKDAMIQVAVSDNGIGIPRDHIDKIFSIDSGLNRKGTDNEIGTGLGLKMFKDFIEIMGGDFSVKSEENVGTTFYFSLPAYNSKGAEG